MVSLWTERCQYKFAYSGSNGSGLCLFLIQIILYYSLGAPKKESKVDIEENNNEILLKQSSQRSHKGSDDYFKGFI